MKTLWEQCHECKHFVGDEDGINGYCQCYQEPIDRWISGYCDGFSKESEEEETTNN